MSGFGKHWSALKLDVRGRTFFAVADSLRPTTMWGGLVRRIHPMRALTAEPTAPRGWVVRYDLCFGTYYAMPQWVAVAYDLWQNRWAPLRWALAFQRRHGWSLIEIAEADYYRNARPRGWRNLPRFS